MSNLKTKMKYWWRLPNLWNHRSSTRWHDVQLTVLNSAQKWKRSFKFLIMSFDLISGSHDGKPKNQRRSDYADQCLVLFVRSWHSRPTNRGPKNGNGQTDINYPLFAEHAFYKQWPFSWNILQKIEINASKRSCNAFSNDIYMNSAQRMVEKLEINSQIWSGDVPTREFGAVLRMRMRHQPNARSSVRSFVDDFMYTCLVYRRESHLIDVLPRPRNSWL